MLPKSYVSCYHRRCNKDVAGPGAALASDRAASVRGREKRGLTAPLNERLRNRFLDGSDAPPQDGRACPATTSNVFLVAFCGRSSCHDPSSGRPPRNTCTTPTGGTAGLS